MGILRDYVNVHSSWLVIPIAIPTQYFFTFLFKFIYINLYLTYSKSIFQ